MSEIGGRAPGDECHLSHGTLKEKFPLMTINTNATSAEVALMQKEK